MESSTTHLNSIRGRHAFVSRRWMAPTLFIGLGLTACDQFVVDEAITHPATVTEAIASLPEADPQTTYEVLHLDEERPYTGLAPLDPPQPTLPARLLADDAITLSLAGSTDDASLAALIEAATGMPVRFAGKRPSEAPADPFQQAAATLPEGGIWTGALDALLDSWTGVRGYAWSYQPSSNSIEITRELAVVFRLNALSGTQSVAGTTATTEEASGAVSSNLARQSVTTDGTYDPWTDITAQLTSLLDPSTRIAAAPATASVTVTGLPRDIDRARNFLAWLSRTTLRPITLTVAVYSVEYHDETSYQLGIAGTLERVFGAATGLEIVTSEVSIVRPSPGSDSLAATVGALQTAGTISRELTATVPSINAQPAQFFELFSEAYLREIRTTVTDNLVQTNLIPGNVSSGFAMTYVAQIVAPNELLVRLFASILDRPAFNTFGTEDLRLQLPSFGNRAIQLTQRVGRGETLIVTGFRDRGTTADNSGTFDASVPVPFGGADSTAAFTEQVLMIRAEAGEPMGIVERQGEAL